MEINNELINLIPTVEEIQSILNINQSGLNILCTATKLLRHESILNKDDINITEEKKDLLQRLEALSDRLWERIHTGYFSLVPKQTREAYALANYFKIVLTLLDENQSEKLEQCSKDLDYIKLLGQSTECCEKLHKCLEQHFISTLSEKLEQKLPIIEPLDITLWKNHKCDIPILNRPSLEKFGKEHYQTEIPALMEDCISDWPALTKWRDLNYLQRLAGHRCVPVEVGANYVDENWSNSLVKLCDFLTRQFGTDAVNSEPNSIEYLAQHELFEQIPDLYKDIRTPDYCMLGDKIENMTVNAWLGPKGTYSPLHYDPKHNLLCQIFGAKKVFLAKPDDTKNLYVNESRFLANTSSIPDTENIDYTLFPNAINVKFYEVLLLEGNCLYIPPKWWHSVRSQTPSFSVSFWWD